MHQQSPHQRLTSPALKVTRPPVSWREAFVIGLLEFAKTRAYGKWHFALEIKGRRSAHSTNT
jgi:hypothetical protein